MDLLVIYEDNHIIVVEKPSGILSQAGSLDLEDMLSLLKAYIKKKYHKPGKVFLGLVHRLDTNVGGVMVFARTSKAAKRLSEQIRNHLFDKKYLAVCLGELEIGKTYELVDYLDKDEVNKLAIITSNNHGKLAKLQFNVLATKTIDNQVYSLINIELETGRFHQIRAQLANYGNPIYNDSKYGTSVNGYSIGLFSYELSFLHPTLQEKNTYRVLPSHSIFKEFINEIKKFGGSL